MIAAALDTSVEIIYASRRDLAGVDLGPEDFILYHHPMTGYPHVLDTGKIRSLGFRSTSPDTAMARTLEERIEYLRDRPGEARDRKAEERLIADLAP